MFLHFFAWRRWTETVDISAPIPTDRLFHEILVPTTDTARYSSLLNLLVTHHVHVLFGGPTGTGKTVYIKDTLSRLDRAAWSTIFSTFSAKTSANMAADVIDAKLDKRRKGVYGPPFGMKAVVFVDDLNMPSLEVYGAQPPVELLRQFMDHEVLGRVFGPCMRGARLIS